MATVNKDFKIKSGLIVEGTTGTINGQPILTEASTQFIIDTVGGSATSNNTPDSVVLRDGNGDFAAGTITADIVGDVTGQVSDISNHSTSGLTEGTNLYFTDARAVAAQAGLWDASGSADNAYENAVTDANAYADQQVLAEASARGIAITNAVSNLETYADNAAGGAYNNAVSDAAIDASSKADAAETAANAYTDSSISTEVTNRNSAIATAKSEAIASANGYTDTAVAGLVDSAPALLDTLNEIAAAIADNPNYATDVANLVATKADTTYVDSEIANAISTTTYTAGTNIDITGNVVSVTGLDSADISDFNTAALSATNTAYDSAGSASSAQSNAASYTDGEIVTALSTAQGYANTAELNATNYADANFVNVNDLPGQLDDYFPLSQRGSVDGVATLDANGYVPLLQLGNIDISGDITTAINALTTDDIEEGSSNLYFTDERAVDAVSNVDIYPNAVIIDNVAKQVAATLSATTAGVHVATAFAKASYRSAEFLVKVAYGDHTEISKVLLTLDVNDNIAITEYGIVGTNGSGMTVSAGISGNDVQLLVTTANNNSTVTAVGTLLV
jgi:hypothetical protein